MFKESVGTLQIATTNFDHGNSYINNSLPSFPLISMLFYPQREAHEPELFITYFKTATGDQKGCAIVPFRDANTIISCSP